MSKRSNRPKICASRSDAVLVDHMSGGSRGELARQAADEPLASLGEDDERESSPKRPFNFTFRDNMFANIRVVKTKWACHICGKKFTRESHMLIHVLSYNGERPKVCPQCGKAFTRVNDCRRHEKIHRRR